MKVIASRSGYMRRIYKTMAAWIALVFLLNTSLSYAAPDNPLPGSGMGPVSGQGLLYSHLASLELPLSLGHVKETHIGSADKPAVIYIQDAHCNYSCQKSIESIIGYFNKKYGVNLATVEGGAGSYDFSLFTSIPDIEMREKIADYFVREGRVTGVELFAILNPDKLKVKGLEEPALYDRNLAAYRQGLAYRDEALKYLKILEHFTENLKGPIFSKNVNEFDKKKSDYNDRQEKLKDYTLYLESVSESNQIDMARYRNFMALLQLIEDEKKIDFKAAEREKEAVIDLLTEKLSKYEVKALVEKSIEFRNKNLSAVDFYEYIFQKADLCGADIAGYPNLMAYREYLKKYDNVEKDLFFEEIFDAERHIAERLFKNSDERTLFYLSDGLSIMDKFFSVSLTRRLYDYYREKEEEFKTDSFITFINRKAAWYKMPSDINPEVRKLDAYKENTDDFYRYSFERDNFFIKNLNKYSAGVKALFMVTGGFHSENMAELMKANGYSYILITPKLASQDDNPYFHLLAGSLSPIESVISESNSVLALRSVFSEMGLKSDTESMCLAVNALWAFLESRRDRLVIETPLGFIELTTVRPEKGLELGQLAGKQLFAVPVRKDALAGQEPVKIAVSDFSPTALSEKLSEIAEADKALVKETGEARVNYQIKRAEEVIDVTRDVSDIKTPGDYDICVMPFGEIDEEAAARKIAQGTRTEYGGKVSVGLYQAKDMRAFEDEAREKAADLIKKRSEGVNAVMTVYAWDDGSKARAWEIFRELAGKDAEKLKERLHVVKMDLPVKKHISEVEYAVLAIGVHAKERFERGDDGRKADRVIMEEFNRRLVELAKALVENPQDITIETLIKIFMGELPLICKGISTSIKEWRQQQEALLRSL